MLITFLLAQKGLVENSVLFLSAFFRKHKKLYYKNLSAYHDGDVFEWLDFFLEGVIKTAEDGIDVSKKIRIIRDEDMEKIQALAKRESESSMKVLRHLFANPIVTTKTIMSATGFSRPGSQKVIDRLMKINILKRISEKDEYDRKYVYERYFNAFVD